MLWPSRNVIPAQFPGALDLIVVASSAGGIPVVKSILAALPSPFSAPIVIVQHLSPTWPSSMAHMLGLCTKLSVKFASDGERLRAGMVYIAPPNRHLVIGKSRRLRLDDFPKVAFARPAADPLFESAAHVFGPRVLGLVLSGMGHDGAAGVASIRRRGGIVIVQDPQCAEAPSMPLAAMRACPVDLVLPPTAIPSALVSLTEVFGTRNMFCSKDAGVTDAAA
jgi:two-component system, chemotaxis family, protein-glutamate methylesterase/glutaminase